MPAPLSRPLPSVPPSRPRSHAPPRTSRAHLDALRSLGADVGEAFDGADSASYVAATRATLARVIEVFAEIQRQDESALELGLSDDSLEDFGDVFGDVFGDTGPLVAETRPRAADLCFGGAMELGGVVRQLDEARTPDEALVACEAGRRKARRALRAVLEAAADLEGGAVPRDTDAEVARLEAEIENAIVVRKLYARFRRSLRRPSAETPDEVMSCLRYAAGALAMLLTATESSNLRVSDRSMLRGLRDRVFAWARSDKDPRAGLDLLEDVFTSADLLRGINQRQELRAHDRALVADLVRAARFTSGTPQVDAFSRIEGMDDEIDSLIEHGKREGFGLVETALRARLALML